jgi:hypothetical protein
MSTAGSNHPAMNEWFFIYAAADISASTGNYFLYTYKTTSNGAEMTATGTSTGSSTTANYALDSNSVLYVGGSKGLSNTAVSNTLAWHGNIYKTRFIVGHYTSSEYRSYIYGE